MKNALRTISANSNSKATQTVVGSSPTVSIRQKCHKCMRKTHAANLKRIKQNSTSLVKWFKSTKMKCLENVNMGVIRRCFLRRIGWRAHTAILHKRKLFKSFSYGSTPYTPTIPPIKNG
jgi:hypothetical protein